LNLRTIERLANQLARNKAEAATASRVLRYAGRGRIAPYADEYLGVRVTPKQLEIFQKLEVAPYRVLARSANTQGKTFAGAVKVRHFYETERPSITLVTAPTAVSVRDLAFKELRTLKPRLAGFSPKDTRLQSAPDHFVHGMTAAKADAFQGRHGVSLGLWFDEATGVDPEFWSRGETMFESTGRHWWLATYNPNDTATYAYQAEEWGGWHVVHLSALEHPNIIAELQGKPPPIPAAIRLSTLVRRLTAECSPVAPDADPDPAVDFEFQGQWYTPKTVEFESQILGRWPTSPTSSLFSPAQVDACFGRAYELNPRWQVTIGCDVARFGDDLTAIAVRCGPCLLGLETHSKVNTTRIAERLRDLARATFSALQLDPDASTTIPIFIDDTGGYGAGVIDQAAGYNFIGVNASTAAVDVRYANTRTQLMCDLAALSAAGALDLSRLSLNDRKSVKQELVAARYLIDAQGRRKLDSKQKVKELLKRSPDRADAIALAYYLAATGS
jgi:hypothetical protein